MSEASRVRPPELYRRVGWILLLAFAILLIVSIVMVASGNNHQSSFQHRRPVIGFSCDYSQSSECLDAAGNLTSCVRCSFEGVDFLLTAGQINDTLSVNSPQGTFPFPFFGSNGERTQITRYNQIRCDYGNSQSVQGQAAVPCVLNGVLSGFVPTTFLDDHVGRVVSLGWTPLTEAVQYPVANTPR